MPRFVLLEHRRDGVHWDLMLEAGGALRTWALQAPIAGPSGRVPARALPDHRLAYLDYEGEISGGRGTVRRVDRGTYRVRDWSPERVRVRLEGDQVKGEVVLERDDSGDDGLGWAFGWGNVD
jgi:hypothetical protein